MADLRLAELEALYRGEYRRFLRVALAVLRDEERAVDAVQEAFATAVQKRGKYRGDGPLEAWVWRMVVNAALKEHARPRPAELPELQLQALAEEPPAVAEAIARLPERQRLALFLRYYADLDYGSIATALEITPGTVAATLNAAHASLRRLLQEVHR
jgi:RNA polymerase sigma-70 factor (ECF subfamily)